MLLYTTRLASGRAHPVGDRVLILVRAARRFWRSALEIRGARAPIVRARGECLDAVGGNDARVDVGAAVVDLGDPQPRRALSCRHRGGVADGRRPDPSLYLCRG